jgi:hypothetical protein
VGPTIHSPTVEASGLTDDQRRQLDRLADLLRQHSDERAAAFWDTVMSPCSDRRICARSEPYSRPHVRTDDT